jgi:hypothetical protein
MQNITSRHTMEGFLSNIDQRLRIVEQIPTGNAPVATRPVVSVGNAAALPTEPYAGVGYLNLETGWVWVEVGGVFSDESSPGVKRTLAAWRAS